MNNNRSKACVCANTWNGISLGEFNPRQFIIAAVLFLLMLLLLLWPLLSWYFFCSYLKSFFTEVIFWSLIQNVVADFVMCPCHTRLVDIFTGKKSVFNWKSLWKKLMNARPIVRPAQISCWFSGCFHNISSARWASCLLEKFCVPLLSKSGPLLTYRGFRACKASPAKSFGWAKIAESVIFPPSTYQKKVIKFKWAVQRRTDLTSHSALSLCQFIYLSTRTFIFIYYTLYITAVHI